MSFNPDPSLPADLRRSALDTIEERELDLLFLQEFHTSSTLRAFFFRRVAGDDESRFVGAWRGIYTNNGETDLLLLSDLREQGRVAIMIEDKINAPFQLEQAQRYRLRGQQGQRDGLWDRFYTCLCSPKEYLAPDSATAWDAVISFEAVHGELRTVTDRTSVFLADAIQFAIKKHASKGYMVDPAATTFWREYNSLYDKQYATRFYMPPLRERHSRNDTWPRFAVGVLPVGVILEHKPSLKRVDLTFKGATRDEVLTKLGRLLPANAPMRVIRVGGSTALSYPISKVVPTDPFVGQETYISEAFEAVEKMLALWPAVSFLMGYSSGEATVPPA